MTSDCGLTCEVYVLELDRCQHPEHTVPTLAIVEDLEVLEHGVGQFDPRFPSLPIQEFGLHSAPERFDHGVVIAIADRSHRRGQDRVLLPAGECPGRKLHSVARVNECAGCRASIQYGHSQSVWHQCRCLRAVDRPPDDSPRKRIQDNGVVNLAFTRGKFRDIRDPQLIRLVASELAVHEIVRGRSLMLGTRTLVPSHQQLSSTSRCSRVPRQYRDQG